MPATTDTAQTSASADHRCASSPPGFRKRKIADSGAGFSAISIEQICYLQKKSGNQLGNISGIQNTSRLAMKKVLPTC